jgi:hypothetical protein
VEFPRSPAGSKSLSPKKNNVKSVTSKEISKIKSTKDAIKAILKQDQPIYSINSKNKNSDYYETKKVSHKNGQSIFQKQSTDLSVRSKLASSKITHERKEKQAVKGLHIATSQQSSKQGLTSRTQK